jgi:hypothetical protein
VLLPALQVKVNALVGSMPDGALQVDGGVVEEVRQPPYVQGAFQIFDVSLAAMPCVQKSRLLPAKAVLTGMHLHWRSACWAWSLSMADSLPAPACRQEQLRAVADIISNGGQRVSPVSSSHMRCAPPALPLVRLLFLFLCFGPADVDADVDAVCVASGPRCRSKCE